MMRIVRPKLKLVWRLAGPFVVGAIAVGIVVVVFVSAAGTPVAFEAESGTLAGGAISASVTGQSGGGVVKFMANPTPSPPANSRDPLKWPFASDSIWNMPIGSDAQFVAANLPAIPVGGDQWTPMPQIDNEPIFMDSTAPLTSIRYNGAAWSGGDRCATSGSELVKVPMAASFTVPNTRDNNSSAFIAEDGRTVLQSQPLARCSAGGPATSLLMFDPVDIFGQGISGAHGGSRLSALGGSIRVGELRPGQTGMRHAIKLNVDSVSALYRCSSTSQCFRWPATAADSGAVGTYGISTNNQNTAMKMGALLALPPGVDITALGLESEPGRQIAWTLQNYGAYIVDSTGGPAYAFSAEIGPAGSLHSQFQADYNMPFEERINDNTAWSRDIQRLIPKLQVVNNNSTTSVGGGGTPRQPLAPAIAP